MSSICSCVRTEDHDGISADLLTEAPPLVIAWIIWSRGNEAMATVSL